MTMIEKINSPSTFRLQSDISCNLRLLSIYINYTAAAELIPTTRRVSVLEHLPV